MLFDNFFTQNDINICCYSKSPMIFQPVNEAFSARLEQCILSPALF